MAAIYLAGNRIGPSAFGHLQVVYNGIELEVQAPSEVFFGSWVFEAPRDHANQTFTPGYGEVGYYAAVAIDIGDRSAADTWGILEQVHTQYRNSGISIDYDLLFNSNTYANTLLSVIGINASEYISEATPSDDGGLLPVLAFPGSGANAFWNRQAQLI